MSSLTPPFFDLSQQGLVTAQKVSVTNDAATNAIMYPLWVTGNGGDVPLYTSGAFTFNPSTGNLTTTSFTGSLLGNASTTTLAATATALATPRTIDGVAFDGTANITVIAPATTAATSKVTPVDADLFPLADSAAAFVLKKITWGSLKAALVGYFQTLTFVSSDQIIASAGALTIPHGLGVIPKMVDTFLVNQAAEQGYSIGDVLLWAASRGNNQGMSITVDATNIYVRYGSAAAVFDLTHKTTGATTNATNGSWKTRFIAKT